jgi:hypothetical protein
MNDQLEEKIAASLRVRLDELAVPALDLGQIASRSRAVLPKRAFRRSSLTVAACAAIALIVFITSGSASALVAKIRLTYHLSSDVMFRAFGTHHRGRIEVTDVFKDTTIAQARRELPFPVVTPAALPPGFRLLSVQTGVDKTLSLDYASAPRKGHAQSRISIIERPSKAHDRTRDTSGGLGFSGGPNVTMRNVHFFDPKRYTGSEFTIGRTHVFAQFSDFDDALEVMKRFKASMGVHEEHNGT